MFGLETNIDAVARGAILGAIAFVWVVILVRLVGLRSFSKMTSFDFIMTIAMGSLLASGATVSSWSSYWQVLAAMLMLFLAQVTMAKIRKSSETAEALFDNCPMILMRDGQIIEEALKQTRVARSDLIAKLREANVLHFDEVRAVILEATGDISVLHGDGNFDDRLINEVRQVD